MAAPRRAPPRTLFDSPVSAGTCFLAIGVTLLYWTGKNITPLTMSAEAFGRQPWRLFTSALVHANYRESGFLGIFHILFNVTWTLRFGSAIETRYGSLKTFLLFAMLAAGSGAAEFAIYEGGIGLSGIGYGLFGFLWMAQRRIPDFDEVMDRRVVGGFVFFFFFCIASTYFGALAVANVAHAAGWALGMLAGLAVTTTDIPKRVAWWSGLVTLMVVIVAGATVLRPRINVDGWARDQAQAAFDKVDSDPEKAAELYRSALKRAPDQPNYWYNLGVALARMDKLVEADEAFKKSCSLATRFEEKQRYCPSGEPAP